MNLLSSSGGGSSASPKQQYQASKASNSGGTSGPSGDAYVGSGIATAGNLYGSYLDNQTAKENAKAANKTNMEIAANQTDFQREMSNTAHQRQVQDMRLAGLNPVLSVTGGSGASTPSGASAQVKPPQTFTNGLGRAIASASDAIRLKKDLESADSLMNLNKSAAVTQASQAALNTANAKSSEINAKRTALENSVIETKMPGVRKRAEADLKHATIDAEWAREDAILRRSGQISGQVSNVLGSINPLKGLFGGGRKSTGYTEETYSQQGEHMGTKSRRYNLD